MNDIIQAIYLMQLYYASNDEKIVNGFIIKRTMELSKVLAVDSVMKNKYIQSKIEDVYELQMSVSEFLDQWNKQ